MPFSRELLIAARKARGYSQPQLVAVIAERGRTIKLQTLRAVEQGRTPNPTGDTVEAIADALGIRMDELYTEPAETAETAAVA